MLNTLQVLHRLITFYDLGPQPWNAPLIPYVRHCVCNSQVHYLLMRMSNKFLAKQSPFDVYRVVTANPSTTPQDGGVVLD